jgi:ERCC4-type nuclease
MIIKIDNRETSLIPLIEHRVEVFLNTDDSNNQLNDIHQGVDDGIDDGMHSKITAKKTKAKTNTRGGADNNGCLVPMHIFNDLEMKINTNTNTNTNITTPEVLMSSDKKHKHVIKKEQLAIGDIILGDDTGLDIIIFERKTLYDLAASIRDGRYNEQSFRLDKEGLHNHNIIYIIEGDIERYIEKKGRVSRKTLISCMFSLLYYKGFSVFRTNSICETADIVVFFADKYYKTCINEKSRVPYYSCCEKNQPILCPLPPPPLPPPSISTSSHSPPTKGSDDSDDNEKYCAALKSHKEKNEYITPDNINIIMLSCVPGISAKVATQLMREYKTIQNLLYQLEKTPDILNTFMIKTEGVGADTKTTFRKINKTCVENIKKFLMTNAIATST